MRQVVCLLADEHARFALVDDDEGELVEFAQLRVPEGFGLRDAALLGTNIIASLGLDRKAGRKAISPPPPRPAEPAVPKKGLTNRGTPRKRAVSKRTDTPRYISMEEVVAVVNAHPEGIKSAEVAKIVEPGGPKWARMAVVNRITVARERLRTHGTPMPLRTETRGRELWLLPFNQAPPLQVDLPGTVESADHPPLPADSWVQ